MLIENYVRGKFHKLKEKLLPLSVGHNKVTKIDVQISCIHLTANQDNLLEIEVRSDQKNPGWIYRDDAEFLTYEMADDKWVMVRLKEARSLVESLAKKHGKQYTETPKAYHIRKAQSGETFYYLNEQDIVELNSAGV